jgi:hypothetical protein
MVQRKTPPPTPESTPPKSAPHKSAFVPIPNPKQLEHPPTRPESTERDFEPSAEPTIAPDSPDPISKGRIGSGFVPIAGPEQTTNPGVPESTLINGPSDLSSDSTTDRDAKRPEATPIEPIEPIPEATLGAPPLVVSNNETRIEQVKFVAGPGALASANANANSSKSAPKVANDTRIEQVPPRPPPAIDLKPGKEKAPAKEKVIVEKAGFVKASPEAIKSGAANAQQPTTFARFREVAQKRGYELGLAALVLVAAIGTAVHFFGGAPKPNHNELILLYPFGQHGGRTPNGRTAPPAMEIEFEFLGEIPCKDPEQICEHYRFFKESSGFEMDVTIQRLDGRWVIVDSSLPK